MNRDRSKPEPGEQKLSAVLDLPAVQRMMDDLYTVTGVGFSIIDLKGNVLVGTGWQDICTQFHRKNPVSCANCLESDLALTRDVKRGEFKTYKCKNNMWDIVTPLLIGERHMGNVFTGQFFFENETPDIELFARQGETFGFDKEAYLAALARAPRHSRQKVASLMDFFTRFATMISDLGSTNLKLAEANAEHQQAAEALRQSEQKYRVVADFTHDWEYWIGVDGHFIYNSPSCEATTGYTQQEYDSDPSLVTRIIHPEDREAVARHFSEVATDADTHEMRFRIIRKDGAERWLGHICRPVFDSQGKSLGRRASNRDITTSIEGEQAVARSRRDLVRAQEVARIGNWFMDVRQDILTWSEESYRIFEVPPGHSMTYELLLAAVHPDDREYVDKNWQAALRREKPYDIEHRIVVNGQTKWVREKAELEFDDKGALLGGLGIVHDITDRKKAEEALQQAAEEWQSTFDSITDIIMLLDPEHHIIRANKAFADIFKMTPEEAIGKHCYEIVHGTDHPHKICPHSRTMRCAGTAREEFLEPKLGIFIEATTLPMFDRNGRCTGSVHIVKNIHERKTAEAEREKLLHQVEEQRQLLESTLDQLPSGVVVRDATGNLIMGNSEVVRIFGPLPQHISAFGAKCCFHRDGRPYKPEEWPMNRTVNKGEMVFNEEIEIVQENGTRMTVLAATAPVKNDRGEVIANVGTFRDITERKKVEDDLNASEIRYRRLFEAAKDGILILDAETGMVRDVNPFLVEMLGYSHQEFLGKKVWELGFLKDVVANKRNFEELASKGYVRYEDLPLETADRRIREVEFVSNVYDIDHQKVIQCNIRDITERKRAEREIEILSRFPGENPNPVLRVNPQCTVLYANQASGYVLDRWNSAVGERLPEALCRFVTETLESGEDTTIEIDCGGRTYAFVFTPIRGFGYVNLYGRDVTERKRAELALQNLTSELEERVEERTHELAVAHSKLLEQLEYRAESEQSLRSLSSRLLGAQEEERRSIARELHDQTGQSLTVLKLMVGRADRVAPEEMKPHLADISAMITEIVRQVRSLSLSLRPGVLDDLGLVPAMKWLFKQLHTQADLKVHFEHDAIGQLPPDASTALYRVTQEALTNVMRHAGVKEVWVSLSNVDSQITLRIKDLGHGFDSTAPGASRSTGLSAMRERAALIGGSCVIESRPGKGTVITILLPLPNQIT